MVRSVLTSLSSPRRAYPCGEEIEEMMMYADTQNRQHLDRGWSRAPVKINVAFASIAIDYEKKAPSDFISL